MKRLLLGLVLAALLTAAPSRAGTLVSCDAITVVPVPACKEFSTVAYDKITMTVLAVDPTTGALDPCSTTRNLACTTGVSTSTIVLEFQEGDSTSWIPFPKDGDEPIRDVSGKGRSFKLPPKTTRVRWHPLTIDAGRIRAVVVVN